MKNFVIPAVLAGLMASSVSFAAQLPASIKDKGEIVVAIMPNYPPMDFKDPATNTLTGLDYDLGNALAERLGVKIKWQETGFEQMINALTTDRVDMVLSGMTDTAERQASVTFIDYFTSGPQFYTLQKKQGHQRSHRPVRQESRHQSPYHLPGGDRRVQQGQL